MTPQSCVQCSFPITSCSSPNASLSLSFSYYPKIYRPIQYQSVSSPIIHVFITYTPLIESCPVEIELLQAYYIDEKKNGLNGLFYNFNKITDWETVGFSSHNRYFQGPTGQTQIHTLLPHRINSKYHFFILNNNSNYEGVVTLNFIAEKEGKHKTFNDQIYFEPLTKSCTDGTIKTVDVHCHPNKKICFPIIMNYTQKIIKKDICEFISFPCIEYDKNDELNEYPIEFYSKIIEEAKSIVPILKDVNFQRTNVMTDCNEKISLSKLFNDLNLQTCLNLRIYVGGSASTNSDDFDDYFDADSDTNFWETGFCVFDKKELKRCKDIEKSLSKKPNLVCPLFGNLKQSYGMKWNSYVNLNLDQFDINKVFVFICFCRAPLSLTDEDGFYMISQIHDNVETLLIRNLVFADKIRSRFVTCFRLEFIEDG